MKRSELSPEAPLNQIRDWPTYFEQVRQRPAIWFGTVSLMRMQMYIDGITIAEFFHDVPEENRFRGFDFAGFEQWVEQRFNPQRLTVNSFHLARRLAKSEEKAFWLWFEWYDRFLFEQTNSLPSPFIPKTPPDEPPRLDPKFARSIFEQSSEQDQRCQELANLLTTRLEKGEDLQTEIATILADLKHLGHDLYSWDESDDWQMWGDDYMSPPSKYRIILQFSYETHRSPSVQVYWGEWPKEEEKAILRCPTSDFELSPHTLQFKIWGSGRVDFERIPFSLQIGSRRRLEDELANTTVRFQEGGYECPLCNGFWFPGSARKPVEES